MNIPKNQPTQNQIDTVIAASEKFSEPINHLDIILNLSTMSRNDVSYWIERFSSTRYQNDNGEMVYKTPVSKSKYLTNKEITEDPSAYQKWIEERDNGIKDIINKREEKFHYKAFVSCLTNGNYIDAAIHLLSLPEDHEAYKGVEILFGRGQHLELKSILDKK